jgi:hypothetical protein
MPTVPRFYRVFLSIALLALPFLFSCSGKPPQVHAISFQLSLFSSDVGTDGKGSSPPYEKLSVFAQTTDEDGLKNLDSLYIINDGAGLYWKLTPATWIEKEQSGDTWIGTNGIRMADFSPLPRGGYRFLILDKGGQRDEREFKLAAGSPITAAMPGFVLSGESITIRSPYERTVLYVLDRAENPIKTVPVLSGSFPLSSVIQGEELNRAYAFLLAAFDAKGNVGLLIEKRLPVRSQGSAAGGTPENASAGRGTAGSGAAGSGLTANVAPASGQDGAQVPEAGAPPHRFPGKAPP